MMNTLHGSEHLGRRGQLEGAPQEETRTDIAHYAPKQYKPLEMLRTLLGTSAVTTGVLGLLWIVEALAS